MIPKAVNRLNIRELRQLRDYYRAAPGKFRSAAVKYLNMTARDLRNEAIRQIEGGMEVRNERFTESSVRVRPARRISEAAVVGSVVRERFTGWEEQQFGGRIEKTATLEARGGSVAGIITKEARFRRGAVFVNPDTYDVRNRARSASARASQMLAVLRRTGYRRPFILTGHRTISDGLFVFHRARLMRLRQFEERNTVRHVPWMSRAIQTFSRYSNQSARWKQALKAAAAVNYK